MFQTEHLQEKWQPVLQHPDLPEIKDPYRRAVTTVILENQENHPELGLIFHVIRTNNKQNFNFQVYSIRLNKIFLVKDFN